MHAQSKGMNSAKTPKSSKRMKPFEVAACPRKHTGCYVNNPLPASRCCNYARPLFRQRSAKGRFWELPCGNLCAWPVGTRRKKRALGHLHGPTKKGGADKSQQAKREPPPRGLLTDKKSNNLASIIIDMRHVAGYGTG
jgi:hypothetical protein